MTLGTRDPRVGWAIVRTVAVMSVTVSAPIALAGDLSGTCHIEMVKGYPGAYVDLYEWNIYLSRNATDPAGQSFRVGLPPNPLGYYGFQVATSGTYSLILDQPLFWGRPKVVPNVAIPGSGNVVVDVELPSDYTCAFGTKSAPWGTDPWTAWESTWYQTFIATGTSITGASFKVAGNHVGHMRMSIVQDNGGAITTWPQVGLSRDRYNISDLADNWVRWRSNEVPTVPGQRYALRLEGRGGSDNKFAIFRRIDSGDGYAGGRAYSSTGVAQNFDLYAMILSDNDQTVVPYAAMQPDGGSLAGWAGVWSQEVEAIGGGLAGAVLYFASSPTWDIFVTFKVRQGSVNGSQVGPAKTGRAAYQASTAGFVAVSWNPGEVPLTPGQKYYIEMSANPGFNPSKFTHAENAYSKGIAYESYGARSDVDLHMQVVEYAANANFPTIGLNTGVLTKTAIQGQSPPDDTFTVRNTGTGTLNYTITDTADWLTVTPSSGAVMGNPDTITVQYSTASLAPGQYSAQIRVTDPAANNSPAVITVRLLVEGLPSMDVWPASLTSTGILGHDAEAASLTVWNTGGGTITYTISTDRPWMTANPNGGTSSGEIDMIDVQFDTSDMAPGTYTGTIEVASEQAINSPISVGVTLNVYAGPDMDQDGDVDISDFGFFQLCFNGPNRPLPFGGCDKADLDADGDADLSDFSVFLTCFNGPDRPPAAGCQ